MSGQLARRAAAFGAACVVFGTGAVARGGDVRPSVKDVPPKSVGHAPRASRPGDPRTPAPADPQSGRRAIAGPSAADEVPAGAESTELRRLREAEREIFPAGAPAPSDSIAGDGAERFGTLDFPAGDADDGAPRVIATGVPPRAPVRAPVVEDAGVLRGLDRLTLPDLPVRWDDRVLRYLRFFRDDPRGHAAFANLYRRSGRYRDLIRRALRRKSLPEDLVWVSMIESGFDAGARSSAGAAGLWQFMPETAKIYGLALDRWVDQRLDPTPATDAAADFLADLHRRFGSWDLALAAFNMGYVGLSSVVRRYNTNDFWSLARTEGTLPWETTLYVPKILAVALVARNLPAFGFGALTADPPIETDDVRAPPGVALAAVADAIGCPAKEIEALNVHLRAGRTPPAAGGDVTYAVHVPRGKGPLAEKALARLHRDAPYERYVVKFGETVDQIAAVRKTSVQRLHELNALRPGEPIRGGTVLLVPRAAGSAPEAPPPDDGLSSSAPPPTTSAPAIPIDKKPRVVVPADIFVYPDRRRVFYRIVPGDTLRDVAAALHCAADDLRRWNDLDPSARLEDGMTLQAFAPLDADLSGVVVMNEDEVTVLPVGSDEFFAALERDRGFKRVIVIAKAGDTLEGIGKRFDVSVRTMERVNRRSRSDALRGGEAVVVYVPTRSADGPDRSARRGGAAAEWADRRSAGVAGASAPRSGLAAYDDDVRVEPTSIGPLPAAPRPDLLPLP